MAEIPPVVDKILLWLSLQFPSKDEHIICILVAASVQWLVVKVFVSLKQPWSATEVEEKDERETIDQVPNVSTSTRAETNNTLSVQNAETPDKPFVRSHPYLINLYARPIFEPPILEYDVFSEALEETSKLLEHNIPNRLKTSVLDGIFEGALTLKYAMWMEDALAEALREGDEDMIRWYVGLKMELKEDMQEDRLAVDSGYEEVQDFNACLTEGQREKFQKLWAPSFDTQRM